MGGNYLVLRPEKASVFDLIAVLASIRVGRRKSVESSKEEEGDVEYRFMIFLSLLVQKILLLVAEPMASMGKLLDMLFNTLSCNGGFWKLLLKLLWGSSSSSSPFINLIHCF